MFKRDHQDKVLPPKKAIEQAFWKLMPRKKEIQHKKNTARENKPLSFELLIQNLKLLVS